MKKWTISELAARQLEAYNRSDLNEFVACYHREVEVYRDGELTIRGRDAFREQYTRLFKEMDFGASVPERVATETTCADLEHYWRIDPETNERIEGTVLVVYGIREGTIGTVRFFF